MMNQFRALLWKNWLLKTSNVLDTTIEYTLPVVICAMLVVLDVLMKSYGPPTEKEISLFF